MHQTNHRKYMGKDRMVEYHKFLNEMGDPSTHVKDMLELQGAQHGVYSKKGVRKVTKKSIHVKTTTLDKSNVPEFQDGLGNLLQLQMELYVQLTSQDKGEQVEH